MIVEKTFELVSELKDRLEDYDNEIRDLLNKMKTSTSGVLVSEYVRCGKKNCKCNIGQLHGPYYYHYFYSNGKLKKRYVCPVNKLNEKYYELQKLILNNKHNKRIQRQINDLNNKINKINKTLNNINKTIINTLEQL